MKKRTKKKLLFKLATVSSLSLPLLASTCNHKNNEESKIEKPDPVNPDPAKPKPVKPTPVDPGTGVEILEESNELDKILKNLKIDIKEKHAVLPESITNENINDYLLVEPAIDAEIEIIKLTYGDGKLTLEIKLKKDNKKSVRARTIEIDGFAVLKLAKNKKPEDILIDEVNATIFEYSLGEDVFDWEIKLSDVTIDRESRTAEVEITCTKNDPDKSLSTAPIKTITSTKIFEGFKESVYIDKEKEENIQVKLKDSKKESDFYINDVAEEDFEFNEVNGYETKMLGIQNSGKWINVVYLVTHNNRSEICTQMFKGFKKDENDPYYRDVYINYNSNYSENKSRPSFWKETASDFVERIKAKQFNDLEAYDHSLPFSNKLGPNAKVLNIDDSNIDDENGTIKFEYTIRDYKLCKLTEIKRKWIMTGFCKKADYDFVKNHKDKITCKMKDISSRLEISDLKNEHIELTCDNPDVDLEILKIKSDIEGRYVYVDLKATASDENHIIKDLKVEDPKKKIILPYEKYMTTANKTKIINGEDGHEYEVRMRDNELVKIILKDDGSNTLKIPDGIKSTFFTSIISNSSKHEQIEVFDFNEVEFVHISENPLSGLKKIIGKNLVKIREFHESGLNFKELEFDINEEKFKSICFSLQTGLKNTDELYNNDGLLMIGNCLIAIKNGTIDNEEYKLPDYVKFVSPHVFTNLNSLAKTGITIKKVDLNQVQFIDGDNFIKDTNLEELIMQNVEEIESGSIISLLKLKKLDLGKTKIIPNNCIYNLPLLEEFKAKYVEEIVGQSFTKINPKIQDENIVLPKSTLRPIILSDGWIVKGNTLLEYIGDASVELIIPDQIKIIEKDAFDSLKNKDNITVINLNNVEELKDGALNGLESLEKIIVSDNVEKIKIGNDIIDSALSLNKLEINDEYKIVFLNDGNWNTAFYSTGLKRNE